MTHVIAVASQKGGVGKTSLTQNLGAELAVGKRVLVVDFGSQSNLTSGWGLTGASGPRSTKPCCTRNMCGPVWCAHSQPPKHMGNLAYFFSNHPKNITGFSAGITASPARSGANSSPSTGRTPTSTR